MTFDHTDGGVRVRSLCLGIGRFLKVNFRAVFVGLMRVVVVDGVIDFDIFAEIEHNVLRE